MEEGYNTDNEFEIGIANGQGGGEEYGDAVDYEQPNQLDRLRRQLSLSSMSGLSSCETINYSDNVTRIEETQQGSQRTRDEDEEEAEEDAEGLEGHEEVEIEEEVEVVQEDAQEEEVQEEMREMEAEQVATNGEGDTNRDEVQVANARTNIPSLMDIQLPVRARLELDRRWRPTSRPASRPGGRLPVNQWGPPPRQRNRGNMGVPNAHTRPGGPDRGSHPYHPQVGSSISSPQVRSSISSPNVLHNSTRLIHGPAIIPPGASTSALLTIIPPGASTSALPTSFLGCTKSIEVTRDRVIIYFEG